MYSILYLILSFAFYARTELFFSYLPTVLMFVAAATVFVDAFWKMSPAGRFVFFEVRQNRHVFWFELNTLFLTLSSIDVLIISIALGADIPVLPVLPERTGFDLTYALITFALIYLISM